MFVYSNANPFSNKVGDCVIRAISAVTMKPWEDIYVDLAIQGYIMGDIMNANAVWDRYLLDRGFRRIAVSSGCADCNTIDDFSKKHGIGSYVVGTGTHATAVIDGAIYDVWDCGQEKPLYYYEYMKEN